MGAKAGWYDDPAEGNQRYWDGRSGPTSDVTHLPRRRHPPDVAGHGSRGGALVLLIAAGILVASLVQNTAKSSHTSPSRGRWS